MIVKFDELPDIRKHHEGEKMVLSGGVFDIVHEGHVRGLEFCRSLGDVLIVGVSSDARVRERKGPTRPIRHELGRMAVVDAFKAVNYTFILPPAIEGEESPTIRSIKQLQPDIFADHLENAGRWEPSRNYIESLGTMLMFNTTDRPDSSTGIIQKIQGL